MPYHHIRGVDIYYEITGKGEPVILLHGLGSSTRDWEAQVEALSQQYQVITCDTRGHGQSGKPPGPYSASGFAQDLIGLMEALSLESAHIIGLSMGGMIAFQLAADAPGRLRSMTIINFGPEMVSHTFKERVQVWIRFAVVNLMGMKGMGKYLADRLFPEDDQLEIREVFITRWAENNQRAYKDAMRSIVGWSVADKLAEMDIPTLVIASEFDYTPVAEKEAYIAKMPNAELRVIPNARHAVPAGRPDEVNAILLDWLDKQ